VVGDGQLHLDVGEVGVVVSAWDEHRLDGLLDEATHNRG
jgi:hypothetical protein